MAIPRSDDENSATVHFNLQAQIKYDAAALANRVIPSASPVSIEELSVTSDEAKRKELLGTAQKILADDAVVGFLAQLPKIGVWDAKLEGMWENAPIQATDLTKVKWAE